MKTMRRAGFVDLVGEERFCPNIDDAIAHARELLEAEEVGKGVKGRKSKRLRSAKAVKAAHRKGCIKP